MGRAGQATIEWIALISLLAIVLVVGAGIAIEGGVIGNKVRCAIFAFARCEYDELEAKYGEEVALMVRKYTPNMAYEAGTYTLPVDFRSCKSHVCSDAPDKNGEYSFAGSSGEQATLFTRVVDQRPDGHLYIQYWMYYPDNTYLSSHVNGTPLDGFHDNDWEGYQVRISQGGKVEARATAHHGYAGRITWPNPDEGLKMIGVDPQNSHWDQATGWTRVSRGSHAGHLIENRDSNSKQVVPPMVGKSRLKGGERYTESGGLRLFPIENLSKQDLDTDFKTIQPPWKKHVYNDPESKATD